LHYRIGDPRSSKFYINSNPNSQCPLRSQEEDRRAAEEAEARDLAGTRERIHRLRERERLRTEEVFAAWNTARRREAEEREAAENASEVSNNSKKTSAREAELLRELLRLEREQARNRDRFFDELNQIEEERHSEADRQRKVLHEARATHIEFLDKREREQEKKVAKIRAEVRRRLLNTAVEASSQSASLLRSHKSQSPISDIMKTALPYFSHPPRPRPNIRSSARPF